MKRSQRVCGGQERGEFLRPLDGENAAGVEVVVEADAQQFVFRFEAVEIEVEERQPTAGVFVDEREGGAGHGGVGAEARRRGL